VATRTVPCATEALPWIWWPMCTLSEEECAAIKLVCGGALRFLQGGRTPASGDDDEEFFSDTVEI
jgi:hypothetical protein